jgi:hypothetical protein
VPFGQPVGPGFNPARDTAVETAEKEFRKDVKASLGIADVRTREETTEERHSLPLRRETPRLGTERPAEPDGGRNRRAGRALSGGHDEPESDHTRGDLERTGAWSREPHQKSREEEGIGGEPPRAESRRPGRGPERGCKGVDGTERRKRRESKGKHGSCELSARRAPAGAEPGQRGEHYPNERHAHDRERRPPELKVSDMASFSLFFLLLLLLSLPLSLSIIIPIIHPSTSPPFMMVVVVGGGGGRVVAEKEREDKRGGGSGGSKEKKSSKEKEVEEMNLLD